MRSRFRCSSWQLLVLAVVSLVSTISLAMGQTSSADAVSKTSEIDLRQIRGTSTKILRSTSELTQTAVSLSGQVSVSSGDEPNGSDVWVQETRSMIEAFRTKLEQNVEHLVTLEEALWGEAYRQPEALLGAGGSEPDLAQVAEIEQLRQALLASEKKVAALRASTDTPGAVSLEGENANEIEAERRKEAEAEAGLLADKLVSANEEILAAQATHEVLKAETVEVKTELDQTRKKLNNVEQEYVVLKSGFQDCRQNVEDCAEEKAALDPQDLSGKLSTAENQLAGLLALRDDLSIQVQDATSTAEQCAAILSRSDDRLTPALTEIERLETALAAEQRKNEALAAQLAAKR